MLRNNLNKHYRWLFLLIFPYLIHAYFELPQRKKTNTNDQKCESNISKSFTLGIYSCLPRKLFIQLKELNLLHLITVSGIHLVILLKLVPFRKNLQFLLLILFSISTFYFDDYFALKRMIWMKLIGFYLDPFLSFTLVFSYDYLIGSFATSPLSHLYSYIFLIILMTSQAKNQLQLCFEMMLAFCLIAGVTNEKLYPLSFIANFIMIPIFNLSFPLFIFNSIFPFDLIKYWSEFLFSKSILYTHWFTTLIPSVKISEYLVIIAIIILLRIPIRFLIYSLILMPVTFQHQSFVLNYRANILELKNIKGINWAKKRERKIAPFSIQNSLKEKL